MSGRLPRPISRTSRKPLVVTSAVRAPVRSVSALMTTVVPCTSSSIAAGSTSPAAITSSTPWARSLGVVETLAMRTSPLPASTTTRSVNVPPMSVATRSVIGAQPGRLRRVRLERRRIEGDAVDGARLLDGHVAVEHVLAHALGLALERIAEAAAGARDGADDGTVRQLHASHAPTAEVQSAVVYSRKFWCRREPPPSAHGTRPKPPMLP